MIKWTQRGLQETSKWNNKDYKKRDIWNKEDNTRYKSVVKDKENLKKKNQTEILEMKSFFSWTKNTMEGHSSRLEQVEDRISDKR
jgi:hypothetical protein